MISVIIPTFNCAPWVRAALESVARQTVTDLEIIVVDDGSTDETVSVVRAFADPRITLLPQQHAGVSVARNRGLAAAKGEFIAFLDGDDLWRPDALQVGLSLMGADPQTVCSFANFVRFSDRTGAVLPDQFSFLSELDHLAVQPTEDGSGLLIVGDPFEALIRFGDFPAFTPVMLFRADRIRGIEFNPSLQRCEDAEFVLRTFTRGRVAFSRTIIADIRRHGRNASANVVMMPVDKLAALESVGRSELTPTQREAFAARLLRAYFDAASAHLRVGDAMAGLRLWMIGMSRRGSLFRKVRGSIRLSSVAVVRLLRGGRPARV